MLKLKHKVVFGLRKVVRKGKKIDFRMFGYLIKNLKQNQM